MSLEIVGKLIKKYEVVEVSAKFKKREFVVELSEEISGNTYVNYAAMQLINTKCGIIDQFNEGDQVKVSFNIRGNKSDKDGKTRYFSNLDAWRVEAFTGNTSNQPQQQSQQGQNNFNNGNQQNQNNYSGATQFNNASQEPQDDLPF